jgi:GH15 family glucan-1,4-alpha-glucosidase
MRLAFQIEPRPSFTRKAVRLQKHAAQCYSADWSNHRLYLVTDVPLTIGGERLIGQVDLEAGDRRDLVLAYSPDAPHDLPTLQSLDAQQARTVEFWRRWSSQCRYAGPDREAVVRSALTLKLLTYAPSGAIIAAPTTSLPESIGGERNWDYRYCWLRDAAFTIRALLLLGYQTEADAFAQWLLHSTRLTHPEIQVVYTIFGEAHIPERTLAHLDGYRSSRPVRVGNGAATQFQIDVYGEVLEALALYHRAGGSFDRDARNLIKGMLSVLQRRWHEPDDGIWEVRSGPAQHIHGKVMAWVGLDAGIELARRGVVRLDIDRLERTQREIQGWTLEYGYSHTLKSFTRTPGSDEPDAALLVVPLTRFLPPDDPRVIGTVDAIQRQLARDELVYRYRGADGLPGGEGAFVICSFWLVEALARIGRIDEAHRLFGQLLDRRTPLGLLAEEIDPASGEQLGNFPQAFSHIGLINAALTLDETARCRR